MNARFIDWIWHIRGNVALAPGQSEDEAFERLDPLFREGGTTRDRAGDTLVFSKKDQAAQDKMSIFDGGVLRIEGGVLRYQLKSRALLLCFLAPLFFIGFAQLTVAIGKYEQAKEAASGKKDEAKEKPEAKKAEVPMNPIDKALGAPAPEKPKKDEKKKDEEEGDGKHSPTSAYVFAGIFAALYVIGRVLEDNLIKRLFRRKLYGEAGAIR